MRLSDIDVENWTGSTLNMQGLLWPPDGDVECVISRYKIKGATDRGIPLTICTKSWLLPPQRENTLIVVNSDVPQERGDLVHLSIQNGEVTELYIGE